jgi:hypothetical protein
MPNNPYYQLFCFAGVQRFGLDLRLGGFKRIEKENERNLLLTRRSVDEEMAAGQSSLEESTLLGFVSAATGFTGVPGFF